MSEQGDMIPANPGCSGEQGEQGEQLGKAVNE